MRWLIYSFILRYPTAALCILALLVVIVFSQMIGWPAYVFLGICVLMFFCCKNEATEIANHKTGYKTCG